MSKLILAIVFTNIAVAISLLTAWKLSTNTAEDKPVSTDASKVARCAPPAVSMGMTKEQLLAACGKPRHISHQIINGGSLDREQWSYDGSYVYLSNGIVDALQYAENGEKFKWGNL